MEKYTACWAHPSREHTWGCPQYFPVASELAAAPAQTCHFIVREEWATRQVLGLQQGWGRQVLPQAQVKNRLAAMTRIEFQLPLW